MTIDSGFLHKNDSFPQLCLSLPAGNDVVSLKPSRLKSLFLGKNYDYNPLKPELSHAPYIQGDDVPLIHSP